MKRALLLVAALLVPGGLLAAEHGAKTVDDAWVKAMNANDLQAVVALYADDATMYPPDQAEAKGKEAIRAVYAGMLGPNTARDVKVLDSHYKTSGNLSTGWGRVVLTLVPKAGGDPQTLEVRFTDVAVKRGGKWLYLADHASAPLPPPPAK
ncbi:MAG: YybH family protein [Thermoanaerobaculia bacterium]